MALLLLAVANTYTPQWMNRRRLDELRCFHLIYPNVLSFQSGYFTYPALWGRLPGESMRAGYTGLLATLNHHGIRVENAFAIRPCTWQFPIGSQGPLSAVWPLILVLG